LHCCWSGKGSSRAGRLVKEPGSAAPMAGCLTGWCQALCCCPVCQAVVTGCGGLRKNASQHRLPRCACLQLEGTCVCCTPSKFSLGD
jgi:hypothetical protein